MSGTGFYGMITTTMAKKKSFGAQVRASRKARGWTQVELARRSKVSQATIAKIETETFEPSERSIKLLSSALKL